MISNIRENMNSPYPTLYATLTLKKMFSFHKKDNKVNAIKYRYRYFECTSRALQRYFKGTLKGTCAPWHYKGTLQVFHYWFSFRNSGRVSP